MSVSKLCARKIAVRIFRENRNGRSYRAIAREDYPGVKPGTLNRFANAKGAWIPKDCEILTALGLKKPSKPHEYKPLPEWMKKWRKVPKEERDGLIRSFVEKEIDE